MGRLSKIGGKIVKNTGETGMRGKVMSSKTMEKQTPWQNTGKIDEMEG